MLGVDDSGERWIVSVREGISAGVERAILGSRWFDCDALTLAEARVFLNGVAFPTRTDGTTTTERECPFASFYPVCFGRSVERASEQKVASPSAR